MNAAILNKKQRLFAGEAGMSNTDKTPSITDHSEAMEWLSVIGQSTKLGFMVISEDLQTIFGNEAAYEYLDLPHIPSNEPTPLNNIIQHMSERGDFGTTVDPESLDRYLKNVRRFVSGDTSVEFPSEVKPPNGLTLNISRKLTPSGKMIVTITDITMRQTQEEVYKIAFELGKSGVSIFNYTTDKVDIHSRYLESILTDTELSLVRAQGFWPILHPDDLATSRTAWEAAVKADLTYDRVFRIVTEKAGIRSIRFYAKMQRSASGELCTVICYFEDVTADLALQSDLKTAKEQAEKTLQAQNNFLARLSHEIRTPMNAVIGITDALVQHGSAPSLLPKLELIQSSAESIMNILEGTLSHTKLDENKLMLDPKPDNPAETVRTISTLWHQQAIKNGTKISCHIDPKVPETIVFDKFRYEQCINNLVSNAIKFSPNGHVQIILTLSSKDPMYPRLVLAVKDNGIGMTKDQQTRVFDAYTQADKSISSRFGGTGLGMNIAKQIIEMMGGTISLKSELGKGTIFALSLPLPELAEALKKEKKEEAKTADTAILDQIFEDKAPPETSYSNLKILVADDNPTNHLVVESLLQSVVGELHQANNGQEVLDILDVQDIDIVLMDIHMPVMDGIESTLAIRSSGKHWSDILIIALTADPQYQQLRMCKNIGMDDSLGKPVKLTSLLESFDRVLNMDRKAAPYKDIYQTAV